MLRRGQNDWGDYRHDVFGPRKTNSATVKTKYFGMQRKSRNNKTREFLLKHPWYSLQTRILLSEGKNHQETGPPAEATCSDRCSGHRTTHLREQHAMLRKMPCLFRCTIFTPRTLLRKSQHSTWNTYLYCYKKTLISKGHAQIFYPHV